MKLSLHLFGSPRITVDGAPLVVDTRKATALLAYLVVTGETHQRDTLAGLLWPDYDQTSARAALRRTLSTLNRALEGPAGGQAEPTLAIARESVGLNPRADVWADVSEFRQQAASPAAHGHPAQVVCPACLSALEAAARLYPEPFMAGFNLRDSPNFEEWQFFQEETLRRELAGVLEKLSGGLSAAGQAEAAVQYARRWLALDPLLEEAHRQLMVLYHTANQRNAALRQYRECVRILDQELGVAPLEETTHLYEAILNRETEIELESRVRYQPDLPAGMPAETITPAAAGRAAEPQAGEASPVQLAEPVRPAAAPPRPLVGRTVERARLAQAFAAITADGCLVTLEGEAGIGKTRLAETFLDDIRQRSSGSRVIQARCYAGEAGLAYAPFIESLGAALRGLDAAERRQILGQLPPGTLLEAGRLLPELTPGGQVPGEPASPGPGWAEISPAGAQTRFFEALRQLTCALLTGPRPGVLFLDDLQWADSASLDLLNYLARRLRGANLLIAAAWRSDLSETVQCLERLAGELTRTGQATRLRLQRLAPDEVIEWVRAYPGAAARQPETLGQRLYQESEGLPFVAAEYLAAWAAQPPGAPHEAGQWDMPASVRDLLRSRLTGLDAAPQQLLGAAAVIGRSFDFNSLREVSGRSEIETVDGLDQLLAAGLVSEQAGQGIAAQGGAIHETAVRYDFIHEKLRALIYEETSLARRRLLHRRAAEALARLPGSAETSAGALAYHYEQAGLPAQAAEYHRLAGERARRLFANVEALAHFQAALAAGSPDAAGLHEALGDLHTLRGEYDQAITDYQTAAALCAPGCVANLEHKLGNVHQRMGEWALADSHYLAGLEAAGAPESDPAQMALQVHVYADRSLVAHARGDPEAAQAFAAQALTLAQVVGDPYGLAQAHNVVGVLARARGRQPEAIAALEASLRAAQGLDDPLARIAALNNLALVTGEAGQTGPAIELARQALALCQKRGDRHREAALHNNLADLLHRAGREEEAMEQLKQAVVIFADIGAPPDTGQAEIWKLTEW